MAKKNTSETDPKETPSAKIPVKYASTPGINQEKLQEWYALKKEAPTNREEAILLAEAVGYPRHQAIGVAGQWAIESTHGRSDLATIQNNTFGIKAHNADVRQRMADAYGLNIGVSEDMATREYADDKIDAKFMTFDNVIESFLAHKAFLETNSRYENALAADNTFDFIHGLHEAGYATGPKYTNSIGNIMVNYIDPEQKKLFKNVSPITKSDREKMKEGTYTYSTNSTPQPKKEEKLSRQSDIDAAELQRRYEANAQLEREQRNVELEQANPYIDNLDVQLPPPQDIPKFGQGSAFGQGQMFMNGGNLYAGGGNFWKGLGAGAYGLVEGVADTVSMGMLDGITDKGYDALFKNSTRATDGIRGIGNILGATGTAIVNPASVGTAISQGTQGVGDVLNATGEDNQTLHQVGDITSNVGNVAGTVVGGMDFANMGKSAAPMSTGVTSKLGTTMDLSFLQGIPKKLGGNMYNYGGGSYLNFDPTAEVSGSSQGSSGGNSQAAGWAAAAGNAISSGIQSQEAINNSNMNDAQKNAAQEDAWVGAVDGVAGMIPGYGAFHGLASAGSDWASSGMGTTKVDPNTGVEYKEYDKSHEKVADSWLTPTHEHQTRAVEGIFNDEAGAWGDAAFEFMLPGIGTAINAQIEGSEGLPVEQASAQSGLNLSMYGGNIFQLGAGMISGSPAAIPAKPITSPTPASGTSLTGLPIFQMDSDYAAAYQAASGQTLPAGAYLTQAAINDYNTTGNVFGWEAPPGSGGGSSASTSKPAEKTTRYYLHPHTGERLDPEVYGSFEGFEDKQLGQALDMTALKSKAKREATKNQIEANKKLLETATPEQKAEMKAQGLTPTQYFQSNTMAYGGKMPYAYGGKMNYAYGGNMFNNGGFGINTMNDIPVTEFNAGGTHSQNPLGGIPQGMGQNGQPNLVEQGELKIPDPRDPSGNSKFIVSAQDDMKITKEIAEANNLPKKFVGKSVRKVADQVLRKSKMMNRDGNEVTQNSINQELTAFINAHETLTAEKELAKQAEFSKKMEALNTEYPSYMKALGGNIHQYDPNLRVGAPYNPNYYNIMGESPVNPASQTGLNPYFQNQLAANRGKVVGSDPRVNYSTRTGTEGRTGEEEIKFDPSMRNIENKTGQQSWMNFGAQALPAAFNILQGAFGKADTMDVNHLAKTKLKRLNNREELRGIGRDLAGVSKKLKGSGQAGSYLANMQRFANVGSKARAASHARIDQANAGIDAREQGMNLQVGQFNAGLDARKKQYDASAQAAKMGQLTTGITQVADMARSNQANDLAADYNSMYSDRYSYDYLRPWEKKSDKNA